MEKIKYYDVQNIIDKIPDAHYYVVLGERSNGKTYSTLKHCIKDYFENDSEFVYIRRFEEDVKYSRGSTIFNALIKDKVIEKLSHGKWNDVYYYASKFYLMKRDKNNPKNTKIAPNPFGYALSLSSEEHDKSDAYPNVCNIFFEEFLSRKNYLPDEFISFTSLLSLT